MRNINCSILFLVWRMSCKMQQTWTILNFMNEKYWFRNMFIDFRTTIVLEIFFRLSSESLFGTLGFLKKRDKETCYPSIHVPMIFNCLNLNPAKKLFKIPRVQHFNWRTTSGVRALKSAQPPFKKREEFRNRICDSGRRKIEFRNATFSNFYPKMFLKWYEMIHVTVNFNLGTRVNVHGFLYYY